MHHSPFPTQRGESCRSAPMSPTRAPPPTGHEVPLLSVAHSPLPVLVQRASMGNCVRVGGTQPDPPPPRESMSPRGRPVAQPHGHPPLPAAYTEPAYHFGIPRDPSAPARPGDPPRDLFPPNLVCSDHLWLTLKSISSCTRCLDIATAHLASINCWIIAHLTPWLDTSI